VVVDLVIGAVKLKGHSAFANQFTESHPQGARERVSNLNRHASLAEFDGAKVGAARFSRWRVKRMLIPPQTSIFKVKFDHVRVQRVHAEVAIYI
jgi:hypothetical protein